MVCSLIPQVNMRDGGLFVDSEFNLCWDFIIALNDFLNPVSFPFPTTAVIIGFFSSFLKHKKVASCLVLSF